VKPLAKLALAGEELGKPAVVVQEPPPPPAPEPEPEPPPEPKAKMATVSAQRAALRDSPSKRGPRKMVVPRKARVEVVEVMGEWFKVKIQDGSVGWMHESTVIQDAE
jgi:hypothetical protein